MLPCFVGGLPGCYHHGFISGPILWGHRIYFGFEASLYLCSRLVDDVSPSQSTFRYCDHNFCGLPEIYRSGFTAVKIVLKHNSINSKKNPQESWFSQERPELTHSGLGSVCFYESGVLLVGVLITRAL